MGGWDTPITVIPVPFIKAVVSIGAIYTVLIIGWEFIIVIGFIAFRISQLIILLSVRVPAVPEIFKPPQNKSGKPGEKVTSLADMEPRILIGSSFHT